VKKVLLAGEGKNELGGWAAELPYRNPDEPGVLVTLLRHVAPEGWKVSEAVLWKQIRKYRSRDHRSPETRAVLGLVQHAKEHRFDAVVFSRDRDGEKPEHEQRERDVSRGLEEATRAIADAPPVVGGLAIQRLESWVLATLGISSTESMKNAEVDRRLTNAGVRPKDTEAMVHAVATADLAAIPADARSLQTWLARAREILAKHDRSPPEG
jgi:hypothetical protein